MTAESFQQIASTIPTQPGIYKYFNVKGELLYIGKAKNLRKRVSSYFNKTFTTQKTYELVTRIDHIEFAIVNNEQDAFLLERTLIRQFQPKFNINLKDDKSYPYIVIKNEPFPRVFLTRKKINDGSEYLGPFTSVNRVRELLDFIKQDIRLRICTLSLTPANIAKKKFKVCLEYHLGNCKGPCQGLQTLDNYKEEVAQLKNFMKGNIAPILQHFKTEMKQFAQNMEFEKAEIARKKIEELQNYTSKSIVVNANLGNLDVFFIVKEEDHAYVNYLMVQEGAIIQTHTTLLQTHLEESIEEILPFAIAQIRSLFNSHNNEIVLPFTITYDEPNTTITVPKAGDKKKLLDLSEKNVYYYQQEMKRKQALLLEQRTAEQINETLLQLQQDLQLQQVPMHIECFDNSNFQGSYPVSAMVCFKNGVPSKKDYRHYNVKTVEGINDFATMKEVVYRRYKRLTEEQQPLPQLVVIDGGKGQLSAALQSIEVLNLIGKMTLVGLAKNEEEIFFAGDKQSIKLPYQSNSLQLIRSIRDEVHRFGITFHRNKRSSGTFKNELEQIKGIGKNTAETLLKIYKSVNAIKPLTQEELAKAVGDAKATIVWGYFNK